MCYPSDNPQQGKVTSIMKLKPEFEQKLRGPFLTLTMDDIVNGHEIYGYELDEQIYSHTDELDDFHSYYVYNKDGKFCVYYLTNGDFPDKDDPTTYMEDVP